MFRLSGYFLALLLLVSTSSVFAQKVVLVKKNKAVIIVKKGQKFSRKAQYFATGKKSDAMFKVLKKKGRKIIVKFYDGKLVKNDIIKIEKFEGMDDDLPGEEKPTKKTAAKSQKSFRYGVTVIYNGAANSSLGGTITNGSDSGDADLTLGYNSSFGFGGELRYQMNAKYTLFVGGEYHLARSENKLEVAASSPFSNEIYDDFGSIQTSLLYGGLAYHINQKVYLPVALSYNFTRYDTGISGATSAGAGGIGFQLGGGFWVNKNISVEANYRLLTYSIQVSGLPDGDRVDSEDGFLSSLDFALKYFF